MVRSSRCTAQCSAVEPSPCAAFTSTAGARCSSSARTAAASLCLTAWISRVSVAADALGTLSAMIKSIATTEDSADTEALNGFVRLASFPPCPPWRRFGGDVLQRKDPRVDPPRAVPNLVDVHTKLIEERQMQVCERHVLEPDVPSAPQMPGAAAGK